MAPRQTQTTRHSTVSRVRTATSLEKLAVPLSTKTQLRDLVRLTARKSAAAHAQYVLFTGPNGTGKTLAAKLLAGESRLDLFRVELEKVISKYIGETEKNLARLFDRAERAGAILFFDEADALFGKRSEVKDAHDRYANAEIACLLRRLESYKGIVILATKRRQHIDSAFLRRIRFVIGFPLATGGER